MAPARLAWGWNRCRVHSFYPTKYQPDGLHLTSMREGFRFDILAGNTVVYFSFQPDSHHATACVYLHFGNYFEFYCRGRDFREAGLGLEYFSFYPTKYQPDWLHLTSMREDVGLTSWLATKLFIFVSSQTATTQRHVRTWTLAIILRTTVAAVWHTFYISITKLQILNCSWEALGWLLGGRLGAGILSGSIAFTQLNISPMDCT